MANMMVRAKLPTLPVKIMAENPAEFFARLKIKPFETRKMLPAVMEMPYPADPLLEPELAGLTYYQVALLRQAERAARYADLQSLEFMSDRLHGRPTQVSVNVGMSEDTYTAFLDKIAKAEEGIIDVAAIEENELGL